MANPSKRKGDRLERHVVHFWQRMGFNARRMPLSGAMGGDLSGDVRIWVTIRDWIFECKSRKDDFKKIYGWMDGNDCLVIRSNFKEALYIIPESRIEEMIRHEAQRTLPSLPEVG